MQQWVQRPGYRVLLQYQRHMDRQPPMRQVLTLSYMYFCERAIYIALSSASSFVAIGAGVAVPVVLIILLVLLLLYLRRRKIEKENDPFIRKKASSWC